jgi:exonuclease SbcD
MNMRFIHTADWHLGRQLCGHLLLDDQAYLLEELLHLVTEVKAEAVVIAGDIYDRGVPPAEAVELFNQTLNSLLLEKKVKVLYIAGNHDSARRINFGSRLFAAAGLFVQGELQPGAAPIELEDGYGPVYFSLLPYMEPSTVRAAWGREDLHDFDKATGYAIEQAAAKVPAGARSVAVAHAFLAGGSSSESERPLSVGGSSNVSPHWFQTFDYTALGHLHKPQRAGADTIRYSGSLMKYSIDEAEQKKGMLVVDIDGKGAASHTFVPLPARHDVRRVKGKLAAIRDDRTAYPKSDDFVGIELTDDGPTLSANDVVRQIYPNYLYIHKDYIDRAGERREHDKEVLDRSEKELFGEFFEEMTGSPLTAAQEMVLTQEIETIFRQEREAEG